jgi:hypothetical protein
MRIRTPLAVLGLAAVLAGANPVAAQTATHPGFSLSTGYGYGSLTCAQESCANQQGSIAGFVTMGKRLSKQLVVGVGSHAAYVPVDDITLMVSGIAQYSPAGAQQLNLTAGVGMGWTDASNTGSTGVAWVVGAGYDLPIGGSTALRPFVNYMSIAETGGPTNVLQLGLALGFN